MKWNGRITSYSGLGWSVRYTWVPFYYHCLTLISAWISDYIHYNVWDEITYPFLNFNCATVDVYKWISSCILHFTGACDYLSMLGLKSNHVSKRGYWHEAAVWGVHVYPSVEDWEYPGSAVDTPPVFCRGLNLFNYRVNELETSPI